MNIIFGILIGLLIALMCNLQFKETAYNRACEAKGGVPITTDTHGKLGCVKKDGFIKE